MNLDNTGTRIAKFAEYCIGQGKYKKRALLERFPDEVDCTSLIVFLFKDAEIKLPRKITSQLKQGQNVSSENISPGDVIIMNGINENESRLHEAVYVGDNNIVHAVPGKGITEDKMEFCEKRGIIAVKRFW